MSEQAGILAPHGNGLGIVALDLEGRGLLSLFVANDRTANFLFVNETPSPGAAPLFTESAMPRGAAVDGNGRPQACMGVAADDADGDGLVDLFVTNFYFESNTLYAQLPPGGAFVDRTVEAGLRGPSLNRLGFGTQFLDADLDGWADLIVTNGHIDDLRANGEPYKMRPQFFRNSGRGQFVEMSPQSLGSFFEGEYLGRGLATLDYDRDGREDVVISHVDDPAALLHNRTQPAGRHVTLQLRGTRSSRDAVGATVRLRVGGRQRVRQLTAGDGYQASNQRQLVFGLGDADRIEELTVQWPSGGVELFTGCLPDACWILIEGQGVASRLSSER
jgi:hypothetical protein